MIYRLICSLFLLLVCSAPAYADVSVFIYHRFDESRYPSTNISIDVFEAQLSHLKKAGYRVLPLSRIAQILAANESLPEKTVGICIDDAFSSFAEKGLPLLQKYGFPATLFVNTDAVGTSGYLSWEQLKIVMGKGIEIGNHTASHPYMVEMEEGESLPQWQERILAEMVKSNQLITEHLGVTPEIIAYTYGEYSPRVIELVRKAGFKAAFAQQSGVIHRDSEVWNLPRFPMGGPYASLSGFLSKLNMSALKVLRAEPTDPVIRDTNPPRLRLELADEEIARGQINCFAQGGNVCRVKKDPARKNGIFVEADKPLSGRRNKYTLTAMGRDGQWRWFSQLWINAKRPVPGIKLQP